MGVDGAIILDMLNLIGRFFKVWNRNEAIPKSSYRPFKALLYFSEKGVYQGDDQSGCSSVSSSSARPSAGGISSSLVKNPTAAI
jgi:hypothetical protein